MHRSYFIKTTESQAKRCMNRAICSDYDGNMFKRLKVLDCPIKAILQWVGSNATVSLVK